MVASVRFGLPDEEDVTDVARLQAAKGYLLGHWCLMPVDHQS